MKRGFQKNLLFFFLLLTSAFVPGYAKPVFLGISAGDMTQDSAVLWGRIEKATSLSANVLIARDRGFQQMVYTIPATIKPGSLTFCVETVVMPAPDFGRG